MKKSNSILKSGKRVARFCEYLSDYDKLSGQAARDFCVGFAEQVAAVIDDVSWEKAILSGHDAADLAIDRIASGFKTLKRKRNRV